MVQVISTMIWQIRGKNFCVHVYHPQTQRQFPLNNNKFPKFMKGKLKKKNCSYFFKKTDKKLYPVLMAVSYDVTISTSLSVCKEEKINKYNKL